MTSTTHFDYDGGLDLYTETLLAAHLDALLTEQSTTTYQRGADPDTLELMALAAQLSSTLTPILPDPAYIAKLKGDLVGNPQRGTGLVLRWRALPPYYRLFARVGGATLGAGLALFALRRALGMLTAGRGRSPQGKTFSN